MDNKIELRDYQQRAVNKMLKQKRIILADEQGLGKTLTSLFAMTKLTQDKPEILVLGPRVALGTWKAEAEKWFGADSIIYSGDSTPKQREKLWQEYLIKRPMLFIATYAMLKEILEKKQAWQGIIADEYHKVGLMNHKTNTFKKFKKLQCKNLFLLTGTPVKKNPADLYAPLHLCDKQFDNYWRFVYKHCVVIEDMFGKTIEPKPAQPKKFSQMIHPYMIRRKKSKVLKELPPLQRQAIRLEMTKRQKKLYKDLVENDMIETSEGDVIACPNKATTVLRLRQLLVSPWIFGDKERGSALEFLKNEVEDLMLNNKPVAICTPFKAGVHLIEEMLSSLTSHIYKIHGDMKGSPREVADKFQKDPNKQKIVIFTIASGMSFDLYEADTLYFVGANWTADDNKQAEARIHRMGQKNKALIKYLLHPGTIDDEILTKLDSNTMAENWTLSAEEMIALVEKQRNKR